MSKLSSSKMASLLSLSCLAMLSMWSVDGAVNMRMLKHKSTPKPTPHPSTAQPSIGGSPLVFHFASDGNATAPVPVQQYDIVADGNVIDPTAAPTTQPSMNSSPLLIEGFTLDGNLTDPPVAPTTLAATPAAVWTAAPTTMAPFSCGNLEQCGNFQSCYNPAHETCDPSTGVVNLIGDTSASPPAPAAGPLVAVPPTNLFTQDIDIVLNAECQLSPLLLDAAQAGSDIRWFAQSLSFQLIPEAQAVSSNPNVTLPTLLPRPITGLSFQITYDHSATNFVPTPTPIYNRTIDWVDSPAFSDSSADWVCSSNAEAANSVVLQCDYNGELQADQTIYLALQSFIEAPTPLSLPFSVNIAYTDSFGNQVSGFQSGTVTSFSGPTC